MSAFKARNPEYEVEKLENSWRKEVFRLVNTAEEQYTHVSGSGGGGGGGGVASGADRHVGIGLQVVEAHPLFPYFLEKRFAIPTSPFFIY